MESSESVALAAVQVIAAAASGAGTAVGQAVGEVVRSRLGRSVPGQAALDGLEQDPEDAVAADSLRSVLRAELTADPEFTEELRKAFAPPQPSYPPHPSGSILIGSSKLRGSQLSLGPLSISNVRNSKGSWFTIAILSLLVMFLAVYGGVQIVTGDDPQDSGRGPESERVVLSDAAQVLPVLPGMGSLPTGWGVKSGFPSAMRCEPEYAGCDGSSISAVSEYEPDWKVDQVRIELMSYPTVDAAKSGYKEMAKHQVKRGDGLDELSLPGVGGDEVMAVSWALHSNPSEPDMTEATGATSVVRVGTVAATVFLRDEGGGGTDLDVLQAITAAMATRIGEAVTSQTPQAAVQL
ncbi:hypothetical protein ABZ383_00840 [Streptomyces sp. NPDC005900]|uniref:hypothetical protein n=1 Tax=Streptomyces sp. NPDC005900 TaxID=3154569 RepID=UPI0033F62C5A